MSYCPTCGTSHESTTAGCPFVTVWTNAEPCTVRTTRNFPPEDYAFPDARNVRIAELGKALLEMNDIAARRSEIPPCRKCELREPCPDHGEPA